MSDQPQGETDDPKGNKTVKNSMNVDGGKDLQEEANAPNHTGATMPDSPQKTEDQKDASTDE